MTEKYPDPLSKPDGMDGLEFFEEIRAERKYSATAVDSFVQPAKKLLPPGAFMQLWVLMLTNTQPAPGLTVARATRTKNAMHQLYINFRDSIPWMQTNLLYAMRKEICESTDLNGNQFYGGMSGVFIRGYSNAAQAQDAASKEMGEFVEELTVEPLPPETEAKMQDYTQTIVDRAKSAGTFAGRHGAEGAEEEDEDEDGG